MDGWITIGTDIDSQKFDKEMKRLEKESEKFAKEEEKLLKTKAKLEIDMSKSDREIDNLNKKIENTFKKLRVEKTKLSNIPAWKQDTPEYNKQSFNVDKIQQSYDVLLAKHSNLLDSQNIYNSQLDITNKKLIENSTCQTEVNSKLQEMEAESLGLHMNFDKVGDSLMNNVKKVGKWVMAVFSLRSAYSMVRQTMSTLTQYNEDLANKLNSIKLVFASALEPLITRMVDLAYKLMVYMNYISKAWFGVDLFASASAKSMSKASKSVKEMRKDLFGFDEANIQNKDGSTGIASSGGGVGFIEPKDVPIPSWVQWIADNKDKVLGFITALGIGIATIKFASFLGNLAETGRKLAGLSSSAGQATFSMQDFGKAIGTGLIVTGLLLIVGAVSDLIFNWDELSPAQKRADIALIALGASFTVLGLTIRAAIDAGTFGMAEIIGVITSLGLAIGGLIVYMDKEKDVVHSVKDAQNNLKIAQDELKKATEEHSNVLDTYENALKKVEEATKKLEEVEKNNKITGEELYNLVAEGKLTYDTMTETQKEVWKAYINLNDAQEKAKTATDELKTSTDKLIESKKNEKIASFENEHATMLEKEQYNKYKKAVIEAFENSSLKADEARILIEKCMADMSKSSRKAFIEDIPSQISEGLNPQRYESFGTKLKNFFKGIFTGIETNADKAIKNITKKTSSAGGGSGGGGFAKGGIISGGQVYGFAKGGITFPKIQYCASGAIINQPGKGVPITQAIGGERGQEGILPLTDSQQMDLLGASIARHMMINATIPVYVGNRQVAREFRRIEANRDFATNR